MVFSVERFLISKDQGYFQKELKNAFPRVNCLELIPEHMTGKLVNESKEGDYGNFER